jgi:peptidoglycan/LPS O-acetylase OafA/YrhL
MRHQRLRALDGFRAISILSVMLFHFFSRWIFNENSSLYPYGSAYDHFHYGYLGVRFFFIISGFVIFFTLENTDNFKAFWIKRMIRLVPTMVIASLATLLVFRLFDAASIFPESHSIANLLPSLSFIAPEVFNAFSPSDSVRFDYINGSYWSLWPEIQFYLFASTIYYFNKKRFLRNFTIASLLLIAAFWLTGNIRTTNTFHIPLSKQGAAVLNQWITVIFDLPVYLVYFCLGVLLYVAYKYRQENTKLPLSTAALLGIFTLIFFYFGNHWPVRLIFMGMLALFLAFIYFPRSVFLLEKPVFVNIGIASYAIYLFHENIGVLMIHSWAGYFTHFAFILPLMVMAFIIFASIRYTHTVEKGITAYLKRILTEKKIIPVIPINVGRLRA